MELIGITQDGVEHKIVNGKWEPPIIVPAYLHERLLRNMNAIRKKYPEEEFMKNGKPADHPTNRRHDF